MHIDLDHNRDLGLDIHPYFDLDTDFYLNSDVDLDSDFDLYPDFDFADKGFLMKTLFLWVFLL